MEYQKEIGNGYMRSYHKLIFKIGTNPPMIIPYHCTIHNFSSLDFAEFQKHEKNVPHTMIGQLLCKNCSECIEFNNVPRNRRRFKCSNCGKINVLPKDINPPKVQYYVWDSATETNKNDIL